MKSALPPPSRPEPPAPYPFSEGGCTPSASPNHSTSGPAQSIPGAPFAHPEDPAARFPCTVRRVAIANQRFDLLVVRDVEALLDAITPEQFARDERFPYWAELWVSSSALARWCLAASPLANARVLELGCGVGLGGIAAARAGAYVHLTDNDPDALAFARRNLRSNLTEAQLGRTSVGHLDWRSDQRVGPFDWIIGADITYERRFFPSLLAVADRSLVPGGTFLIADPERGTTGEFLEVARTAGYAVATVRMVEPWGERTCPVSLHFLSRITGIV